MPRCNTCDALRTASHNNLMDKFDCPALHLDYGAWFGRSAVTLPLEICSLWGIYLPSRTVRGGRISHSRLSLATLLCCFLFFLAARQAQCSRSRTTYVLSHVSRRLCPNEATFMLRQRASCILICAPVYQPYIVPRKIVLLSWERS